MNFFRGLRNHFIPSHENDYRPHLLRRAWLVVFLGLILTAEGFLVTAVVGRPSLDDLAAIIQSQLIELTNEERAALNLSTLTENPVLDAAARAKAEDMAAKEYFSHNGPDGKVPWEWIAEAGYVYERAGENLAVRFVDSSDVVEAWMQSPTHRANIVKPTYTEIGIGMAEGMYKGARATYVVQYFGTPKVAQAYTPPQPAEEEVVEQETPEPVAAPEPQAEQEPAPPQPAPLVAAAETLAPTPQAHTTSDIQRFFARVFADPRTTTNWALGGIAALLGVALALTFFIHIQIQHGRMLMSGAVMTLFALSLLAANQSYFGGGQSASVADATAGSVVISEYGDWISFEE